MQVTIYIPKYKAMTSIFSTIKKLEYCNLENTIHTISLSDVEEIQTSPFTDSLQVTVDWEIYAKIEYIKLAGK